MPEIAFERDRLAAGRSDLRHGGVGANAAATVVKRDARTLPRQLAGDSFANANSGAGYQGRPTLQRFHDSSPVTGRVLLRAID
jgi:hypothetical protein